jgi:hypothetical protein
MEQGDAHENMRFVHRIEITDALKSIVHLFELPCLSLTGLGLAQAYQGVAVSDKAHTAFSRAK